MDDSTPEFQNSPDFRIICLRAGRSNAEAVVFKPLNNSLDGAPHLRERLGNWFPDDWLYSEDDVTLEFQVNKLDRAIRTQPPTVHMRPAMAQRNPWAPYRLGRR